MTSWPFGASRRSLTLAAALIGVVSVAIAAHAALNKRALEVSRSNAATQSVDDSAGTRQIALVIGNGRYPDAPAPLAHPINDARALTATLRAQGVDVDVIEDANSNDMRRAVERLNARAKPGSVVMLFFGGYAIQSGHETYMMPVDAAIWKESDVRRQGLSVEAVLVAMSDKGTRTKLVAIDASRRNPYERRFRRYSHGLGAISAPDNALVMTSAAPGSLADETDGANSAIVTELLGNLASPTQGIEAAFNRAKNNAGRATGGGQIPSAASSIDDEQAKPVGGASFAKAGS